MKRPGRRAGAWKDRYRNRLGRRFYIAFRPPPSNRALGLGELARLAALSQRAPYLCVTEGGRL